MTDVAIYGAGGLGRLISDILLQTGRYRPVAFLDSDKSKHACTIDGLEVLGGIEQIGQLVARGVASMLVAIGDNHARTGLARELLKRQVTLISAVHPLANVAPSAQLGEHVVIGARATICVHAQIGPHTIIAAGAIVEHDNTIGTGVFLHPAVRLAGGVTVEDHAALGIGACVIPGRRVGRDAIVQPGAVVIHDVLPRSLVGGAPARRGEHPASRFVPEPAAEIRPRSLSPKR